MNPVYEFPLDYSTDPSEYYWYKDAFSEEEVAKIIRDAQELQVRQGNVVGSSDENPRYDVRKSDIRWIPQEEKYKWIYERIMELAIEANNAIWKFDLHTAPELMQFAEYKEDGGHFDWHPDLGPGDLSVRKISITIQLSDPSEYEGGDLQLLRSRHAENTAKGKGVAVLFPSYMLHRVTPVTKGTRRSLVLWLGGGHFK